MALTCWRQSLQERNRKAGNIAMMQHQTDAQPIALVCIAAPTDSPFLGQWETHLLPLTQAGVITVWSEHDLQAGANRREELFTHLKQAACIVLLLSADFFASDECFTLMECGLQRHRENNVPLIPLLVRSVAWQDSSLGMLPCLPANGVPIITWEHPDEGWLSAVHGLQRYLSRTPLSLVPPGKRTRTNHERMLHRLRRTYQASMDSSLQGIAWMEPGLIELPDAVRNATHLLQRFPDHSERVLPVGTSILSAYDQAGEELLILGAPGAGKTTLLLDLACELLTRAEDDLTHPIAVIIHLSSWASKKPPLTSWLIDQLRLVYGFSTRLSQALVVQDRWLFLLDGLDEVEASARRACVEAINQYRAEHFVPLVICSRSHEYFTQEARLTLSSAVEIQPLREQEVMSYLTQIGKPMSAIRAALSTNAVLRQLITTPLMLSAVLTTYRGKSARDLPQLGSLKEQQGHIFEHYIDQMLSQRATRCRFTPQQTRRWLILLAQQMKQRHLTEFYLEWLQPSWLMTKQARFMYRLFSFLAVGLPIGLLTGLLIGLLAKPPGGSFFGLVGGIFFGSLIGLFVALPARPFKKKNREEIDLAEVLTWSWKRFWQGSLAGLLGGLVYGLAGGVLLWLFGRLVGGVLAGLVGGLVGGIIGEMLGKRLVGLLAGLVGGVVDGLIGGPLGGLFFGLVFGGLGGGLGGLFFGLLFGASSMQVSKDLHTKLNQGIHNSGWNALRFGLVGGLAVGPAIGLVAGLIAGSLSGLVGGLLFGLVVGLLLGLPYGEEAYLKHYILRFVLSRSGAMPWHCVRFLDEAHRQILLQRIGGGYRFIHPLLQDYFASLGTGASPSAQSLPSSPQP